MRERSKSRDAHRLAPPASGARPYPRAVAVARCLVRNRDRRKDRAAEGAALRACRSDRARGNAARRPVDDCLRRRRRRLVEVQRAGGKPYRAGIPARRQARTGNNLSMSALSKSGHQRPATGPRSPQSWRARSARASRPVLVERLVAGGDVVLELVAERGRPHRRPHPVLAPVRSSNADKLSLCSRGACAAGRRSGIPEDRHRQRA